jgi:hypothetical protein
MCACVCVCMCVCVRVCVRVFKFQKLWTPSPPPQSRVWFVLASCAGAPITLSTILKASQKAMEDHVKSSKLDQHQQQKRKKESCILCSRSSKG